MKRILVHVPDQWAASYYRHTLPAMQLFSDLHKQQIEIVLSDRIEAEDVHLYHAFVLGVADWLDPTAVYFAKCAREMGKKIAVSIDDDIFHLSPIHELYSLYQEHRENLNEMVAATDLFICSTNHVLEAIPSDAKKIVCPNLIDFNRYYPPARTPRPFTKIMLTGSHSHEEDHRMILEDLKLLLKENPYQVQVHFFGWLPTEFACFQRHPHADHADMFSGANGVYWQQHVAHKYYSTALCQQAPDIVLCPLVPSQFNEGKSAIKYQEGVCAGAVVLAQDLAPYQGTQAVLVGHNRWDWYTAIKAAIALGVEGRAALWEQQISDVIVNHSWHCQPKRDRWLAAFETLVEDR